MRKTYKITTLGCKVNQQESEALAADFDALGFAQAQKGETADICVINSCTVTSIADSKTRQRIRQARKANPEALVCVVGCLPEVDREKVSAMPEVDIVVGSLDKERAAEIIASSTGVSRDFVGGEKDKSAGDPRLLAARTRALIKVEDGCDRFCAYCIVPFARGPVRSRPVEDVVSEAKELLDAGYKELVLTGVNLAMHDDIYKLVESVCSIEKDAEYRVRLGSLEPNVMSVGEAVKIAKIEGVCPQFHLSLQSGSEKTLKEMGRSYTPEDYSEIVKGLRGIDPLFSITTDIIVGFPGERDDDFEESLDFVRNTGFARVHVFKYSKRQGTRAADMAGQVPETVKNERSRKMIDAAEAGAERFYQKNKGKKHRVLVYGPDSKRGLTDNGIDVFLPVAYKPNSFAEIVL